MLLRGALNRGFNLVYGAALVILFTYLLYFAYELGALRGRELLIHCLAFPLGILLGIPAYYMNRMALLQLYSTLAGKVYLSSQLALLDSRHGRNALVYFYFVAGVTLLGCAAVRGASITVAGYFALGAYFSANVLPFLFAISREPESRANTPGEANPSRESDAGEQLPKK